MTENKEQKIVVGFWMRLLSDLIDVLILGALGAAVSLPFKGIFYQFGESGLWIGIGITFVYTGILQSAFGQGQTMAKKLLNIQVLRTDGSYLSLPRSFARYLIVALIFYSGWIDVALSSIFPFMREDRFMTFYGDLTFILTMGMIVLVAMHPWKQGIHDLMVDSVVVRKGLYSPEKLAELKNPGKARTAVIVWVVISIVILGSMKFILSTNKTLEPLIKELVAVSRLIERDTELSNVSVIHHWQSGKAPTVNVLGFLDKKSFDAELMRREQIETAVSRVRSSYSKLAECRAIMVEVRTGYNIGIWSFYIKERLLFTIQGELISDPAVNTVEDPV